MPGFATDLWDNFEVVYTRTREGKQFLVKAEEFFKRRVEIEREYSKKLQQLCKSVESDAGTLFTAWNTMKAETENVAKKHGEIADQMNTLVNDPIRTWLRENEKPRKKLRDQARKLIKDLAVAKENCPRVKRDYEAQRKVQDKTQEEYEKATFNNSQSPAVEKLAKKVSAETKKAELADQKYVEAVRHLADMQTRNFNTELPSVLEELEKMEDSRIALMKGALDSCVNLLSSMGPEITRATDKMKTDANAISARADISEFIAKHRTGAPKAPLAEYEPYDPHTQTCHPVPPGSAAPAPLATSVKRPTPLSSSTSGSPSLTVSTPTLISSTKQGQTSIARSANSDLGASNSTTGNSTGAVGVSKARALFDYDASDDTELSFRAGDIIQVLQKDPSGWWQGSLNGKIGVFPSVDWVEEVPMSTVAVPSTPTVKAAAAKGSPPAAAPPPVAAADPKANKQKCRALYQYNAENEHELTIYEGDVLVIEDIDEDGWYSGWNAKGAYGKFPSNYTEKM